MASPGRLRARPNVGLVVALLVLALIAGCTSGAPGPESPAAQSSSTTGGSSGEGGGEGAGEGAGETPPQPEGEPVEDQFVAAISSPQEDSKYGEVGDPGVDALFYDLDLTWDAEARTLSGVERLTFRATADRDKFQLDFGKPLTITQATIGGEDVEVQHLGKDLIVQAPVEANQQYTLSLHYAGTPEPVAAPTERSDIEALGWTIDPLGGVWTMQEPFGAYSWFAVNDHPSDKALYEITVTTQRGWQAVANGELVSRTRGADSSTFEWVMPQPMAPYLVTIAIGPLERITLKPVRGAPMTLWIPRSRKVLGGLDRGAMIRRLSYLPEGVRWLEPYLGRYPFQSAGIVVVDSVSGMETQTMITLGATRYATSKAVVVHELVHQWYGDLVTPNDWRDLWMNEGMATYLQLIWQAEQDGDDLGRVMASVREVAGVLVDEAGPAGDYQDGSFGAGNVYYVPALMWHDLRAELGDQVFWRLVRRWPKSMAYQSADRQDLIRFFEAESGRELRPIFDKWLTYGR